MVDGGDGCGDGFIQTREEDIAGLCVDQLSILRL
jgi:hypothetical protein